MAEGRFRNEIEFKVHGRYALFTDPLTRVGGEKCSYRTPTYEALKGIAKSIYWKPTFVWHIDAVRVMKRMQTQTKGTKPILFDPQKVDVKNTLAIYTFLADVEYQVRAHFEWNMHRRELEGDRVDGKHRAIALRFVERGGRQDVFLGTRDCPGYVEPCAFGSGSGVFDGTGTIPLGFMFHGFDYPDETGVKELAARFWQQKMEDGVIRFPRPEECKARRSIRPMSVKPFGARRNLLPVEEELAV